MRETTCICGCRRTTLYPISDGWFEAPQRDRGGRIAYMCPACAGRIDPHAGNAAKHGKAIGGGVAYQVAFVVAHSSAAMQAYTLKNKFTPNVSGYVSQTWRNLNAPKKLFPTLQDMRTSGEFDLIANAAPWVVGPDEGYTPTDVATIMAAFGPEVERAGLALNNQAVVREGAKFISAAAYMAELNAAKALVVALRAWLENATPRRTKKVHEALAWFVADGNALPAPGLPC